MGVRRRRADARASAWNERARARERKPRLLPFATARARSGAHLPLTARGGGRGAAVSVRHERPAAAPRRRTPATARSLIWGRCKGARHASSCALPALLPCAGSQRVGARVRDTARHWHGTRRGLASEGREGGALKAPTTFGRLPLVWFGRAAARSPRRGRRGRRAGGTGMHRPTCKLGRSAIGAILAARGARDASRGRLGRHSWRLGRRCARCWQLTVPQCAPRGGSGERRGVGCPVKVPRAACWAPGAQLAFCPGRRRASLTRACPLAPISALPWACAAR